MGYLAYLLNTATENIARTAIVSASSEAIGYAATKIQATPISEPWRSVGVTGQWLEFDFGLAKNFNIVNVINHNLTETATITVTSGSAPAPAGNSETITWRTHDAWKFIVPRTLRYLRIAFTDALNPDGFIQVGLVQTGIGTRLGFNFAYGWTKERRYFDVRNRTEWGVKHLAQMYDDWFISMRFENRTHEQMDILFAIFEELEGSHEKLFLIPDADGTDGYFGEIVSNFLREYGFYHNADVLFESDSRGKAIGA